MTVDTTPSDPDTGGKALAGPMRAATSYDYLFDPAANKGIPPSVVPDEFWRSSQVLRDIRAYAQSRSLGDVPLLAALLGRLSAQLGPTSIETGLGPVPLGEYIGLIGASGRGKSRIIDAAADLLPDLNPAIGNRLKDSIDTDVRSNLLEVREGTGEGLIDSFLGELDENDREAGRPQIYDRMLIPCDEGGQLHTQMLREGSTLGAIVRSAWSAAAQGQQNATKELRRQLGARRYVIAIIAAFQPVLVARLADPESADVGTPQRFLFTSAARDQEATSRGTPPDRIKLETVPDCGVTLHCTTDVQDRFRTLIDTPRSIIEAQRPALLARTATLLRILGNGAKGTEFGLLDSDDLVLADMLIDSSLRAIRDSLAVWEDRQEQLSHVEAARRGRVSATRTTAERAETERQERVEVRDAILAWLTDPERSGTSHSWGAMRRGITRRLRESVHFVAVFEELRESGAVTVDSRENGQGRTVEYVSAGGR